MPAVIRISARLGSRVATAIALLLLGSLACSSSALAEGDTAVGWGYNFEGGTGEGAVSVGGCQCLKVPKPVKGLTSATQIAGGFNNGIALRADGTVMTWGGNEFGQLGNGTAGAPVPVPAPVPGLSGVIAIAAGEEHALALLSNGTVMVWGRNDVGQLGIGNIDGPGKGCSELCYESPIPNPSLSGVIAISARGDDSLALRGDGTVLIWGSDALGEGGTGAPIGNSCKCLASPTAVPGLPGAMEISASEHGGMAVLVGGSVRNWGYNFTGQLGTGAANEGIGCDCLGAVSPFGLAAARSVAAGFDHNMALLADGTPEAWGEDSNGQLGNGTTIVSGCHCVPTPGPVTGLVGPQALASGEAHSLALLADGTVDSWGYNEFGQLGDNTIVDHDAPAPVSGVSGASGIAGTSWGSFALIGPSQTLTVSLAGAGAGSVGGSEILCPPVCSARFPQGQVKVLRAESTDGSGFAGFSGPCTGVAPCQVALAQDQAVTATFGPPKGTAITKAKIKRQGKTAKASFSFSAPGAITGYQCALIKAKARRSGHGRHKVRMRVRRPKVHFTRCSSPKAYKHLSPGHYTFEVRALDILGADAKPAIRRFKIKPRARA